MPPTLCFSMSSEAFWVFVYVQVTASPGSRAMLARPVATSVVPFEQTRLVRSQPGTGRVSWIVLVPVAAAPTKVKVRVFGVPDAGSSSRMKLPLWKVVPPPVPVVVKAKSWALSGTASLVTVMVASAVFVYVQVGVFPAAMTARTVVSPGSKPAVAPWAKPAPLPVPMVMTAPLAVQTMFVSVQPASGVSTTSFVPNWAAVNVKGALAVGLAAAVSRVKVAGRPAPVPVKSKIAVPPTLCFSMSSEASRLFVNVQVGVSPASMAARTVVSPGSKPAVAPWAKVPPMPVPMVMTAPLAAHAMFVSVQRRARASPGRPWSRTGRPRR